MDLQRLMDAMSDADRRTRQNYHLTLGKLIDKLGDAPSDAPVVYDCGGSPTDPHSYRGYYSDLAFEWGDPVTVGNFLQSCRDILDTSFEGYKGGDYVMGRNAVLWRATYGNSGGRAIVGAEMRDGRLILRTTELNDD